MNRRVSWSRQAFPVWGLLLLGLGLFVQQGVSGDHNDPEAGSETVDRRLLYVAGEGREGGIRVYDIEQGHELVKELDYGGGDAKGLAASASTERLYVSDHWQDEVVCYDLVEEEIVWRRHYGGYADRLDVTPNGETLFVPLREDGGWVVADARTGAELDRIDVPGRPHNTLVEPRGNRAYLSALDNPTLYVVDVQTRDIIRRVGPFSSGLRPFTVDLDRALAFVNVDGILGYEIGHLDTGKTCCRVEVKNVPYPQDSYHNTPSHGVALSPDGEEVWVVNASGRLHVFESTPHSPERNASIEVSGDPGWITFGLEGQYVYPATGDVVDAETREIVARIEKSEKMIEIDFTAGGRVARVGNQIGYASGQEK